MKKTLPTGTKKPAKSAPKKNTDLSYEKLSPKTAKKTNRAK